MIFNNMDKLFIWPPMLFGAVIGWIVVYFIRQFKEYSHKTLFRTASVFIGGVGLTSVTFFANTIAGVTALMFYFVGIAIGFFLHWIYQLVVSFFFNSKFNNALDQYLLFSSCSLTTSERDYIRKIAEKAEKINYGFKMIKDKLISEKEFLSLYKQNFISETEYKMLESECLSILDNEVITYIEVKKLRNNI